MAKEKESSITEINWDVRSGLPSNPLTDYEKWVHEIQRSDAIRAHGSEDEFYSQVNEASISTGSLTLRLAMLINGGAAVALLAFVGGLLSKGKGEFGHMSAIADSLSWFIGGVLASLVGLAFTYFTHYFTAAASHSRQRFWSHPYVIDTDGTKRWMLLRNVCHGAAMLTAVLSLGCFVAGIMIVRLAIKHLT
jgi:hypothetical protein